MASFDIDGSDKSHSTSSISSIPALQATSSSYDIVIVGSGVLGTVLAISLANSGRSVLVVERDLSPPNSRIVGELLQPGGCISLDKLGLLEALEEIDAVPCNGYTVIHPILGNALIPYPKNTGDKIVNAPQHLKDHWNSTALQQGRSFHHGAFIGSLRKKMMGVHGLDILEATVNDLIECGTTGGKIIGVQCTTKSEKEKIQVLAPLTIIADGYASKFRKAVNPSVADAITRSHFVGIELEDCALPVPGHGHVLLPSNNPPTGSSESPPSPSIPISNSASIGPILLYGISSTTTRMLIDVSTSKTPTKSYLLDNVTPLLPSSVQPSFVVAVAESNSQRVKSMPNSFLPPARQGGKKSKEGVLLAGDAMNMRHPLTGGGMSVAMNDAVLLTELLGGDAKSRRRINREQDPHNYNEAGQLSPDTAFSSTSSSSSSSTPSVSDGDFDQAKERPDLIYHHGAMCNLEDWWDVRSRLEEWHWRRKGVATCVNVLAMALYSLFSADDENLDVLRRGCLKYFHLGGNCVEGPVSLLSALNPSPPLLLYHFFSVALYSIYLMFTDPRLPKGAKEGRPSPPSMIEYPVIAAKSMVVFYTACTVILPVLWSEVDF